MDDDSAATVTRKKDHTIDAVTRAAGGLDDGISVYLADYGALIPPPTRTTDA